MIRIVKMKFKPEAVDTFEATFKVYKDRIRQQAGCTHLDLWQDINDPTIFFTHSHWNSPVDLERYRTSDLFAEVWAKTKIHFDARPEAWSVDVHTAVDPE